VNAAGVGKKGTVEETTSSPPRPGIEYAGGPDVISVLDGDTARLAVSGELTEAARRPLVREMTDLLLAVPTLRRVELQLSAVGFMNSGGMAVLVQLQRLGQPRDIAVVLVDPTPAVIRPLQLSGLWHRFAIESTEEPAAGTAEGQ
jgi:stage II sporulation protein AA (anti-sigma F factor antagonist)